MPLEHTPEEIIRRRKNFHYSTIALFSLWNIPLFFGAGISIALAGAVALPSFVITFFGVMCLLGLWRLKQHRENHPSDSERNITLALLVLTITAFASSIPLILFTSLHVMTFVSLAAFLLFTLALIRILDFSSLTNSTPPLSATLETTTPLLISTSPTSSAPFYHTLTSSVSPQPTRPISADNPSQNTTSPTIEMSKIPNPGNTLLTQFAQTPSTPDVNVIPSGQIQTSELTSEVSAQPT